MNRLKSLSAGTLALLLLAACGSSGMGDILGGGSNNQQAYEIRGVVESVDVNGRSIYLTNVSGLTSMLSNSGGGGTARVYYDANTPVEYSGKTYRPEDLERGDEVAILVDESGNRLTADRMTVLRDVSTGSSSGTYNSGSYGSTIRGTVRYVDNSRRTIEVDRGTGSTVIVEFDTQTPVYFNNTTYRPGDLERGDEIDIRVRDLGSNRFLAQDITVTRNVSGGTFGGSTSSSSSLSTFRGTVRYIDTSRRTIELDSTNWISGFQSGAGSGGSMIVQYDANTSVDVQGRLYPVSNLERGDLVEVQARRLTSGSGYFAERLILVRDVNSR